MLGTASVIASLDAHFADCKIFFQICLYALNSALSYDFFQIFPVEVSETLMPFLYVGLLTNGYVTKFARFLDMVQILLSFSSKHYLPI
ncbi:hypothetical protein ACLKA6_000002 [Drosophila palustris]